MIRVCGLQKRYGRVRALDGLSLTVPEGAIYGFIGQNGAGKTTTIRVLATLALPDAGTAEVGGADVVRQADEVRRLMGYMPDFFGVYDDLKVGEYLEFYAALQGMRGAPAASLRDSLLELVDLADKREEYVESLSRGMRQRLCLARALIHDPRVLLLDEPASGLDPLARVELRELLKELGRLGKTILISSHILAELADLCTHVGVVALGKVVWEGTIGELLWVAERPGYRLRVLRDAPRAAAVLAELPGVGAIAVEDGEIRFHCDGGAEGAAAALAAVVGAGVPVVRFAEVESSLEAAFLRLAREEERETAVG
ncbi:MAG TPA: ABC transporter ATP-binding protein [Chloroflexota bacterium]|nr:ABC transporter ATP-binding protein [Chloroflexota bacterium]